MPWWAWVLIALGTLPVVAYLAFLGLFFAASLSTPTRIFEVRFGGRWRRVYLHEHHWLARILPGWGQGYYPHVYLDGELWPKGKPWRRGIDPPTTQAWMVGHELWHLWKKLLRSDVAWGVSTLWHVLTRHWRNRPEEREAVARQRAITLGRDPDIYAPWLADFDNWGMSP